MIRIWKISGSRGKETWLVFRINRCGT